MKRRLLNMILLPILVLLPAITLAGPAYAACSATQSAAAAQVSQGLDANTPATCDDSGVNTAISQIVTILSLVVGVVAIIIIILSGFKYITSGGDANKVGNAKNTLIYAMIGLAIAALAQFLVHFVLFQSNQVTLQPCPSDHSIKPPACRA